MRHLYKSWHEYMEAFCKVGGVIEASPNCLSNMMASPSIAFIVEPSGEVQLVGSLDKFSAKEYVNGGCFFPQQSLPNMNMKSICSSIGSVLYSKGIVGHVTVDLVSFPDPTSPNAHPLFWAIDLNCYLTDYAAACYFFDFLMEGQLDPFTGKYTISNAPEDLEERSQTSSRFGNSLHPDEEKSVRKGSSRILQQSSSKKGNGDSRSVSTGADETEPRSFMYVRYLHHPGISKVQYKTFFHMCRMRNISFDLEQRQGSTFMLQDCLQSGLLAIMTIGEARIDCLKLMCDTFKFVEDMTGSTSFATTNGMTGPNDTRSDEIDASDVVSSIRLVYKTYTKKEERERQLRTNRINKQF